MDRECFLGRVLFILFIVVTAQCRVLNIKVAGMYEARNE